MKINKSFKIRINILKILRNKATQKIVTIYPKVGVSWYTTWGKLLHLYNSTFSAVWPSQTWYKVYMCLRGGGYVGVYMCHCVCLLVCLFGCVLSYSFVRSLNVDENCAH